MSENTVIDLEYLPKRQRLLRLTGPEHPIVIDLKEKQQWRNAVTAIKSDPEAEGRVFTVLTSRVDKLTRVIRIK